MLEGGDLTRIAPLLLFAVFAVFWTYPLATSLATHIPGESAGDNLTFIWNFWWMREALASEERTFFWTSHLFAPWGTSLVLHTHTALSAFLGATLLAAWPVVAAQNLVLLLHAFLNAAMAYWLAVLLTSDRRASISAAIIFAGSPFLSAHLRGHFNLIGAWTLPLFAVTWIKMLRTRSPLWAAAAGIALGVAVYQDYYYAVYAGVFAVLYLIVCRLDPESVRASRRPRWWLSDALFGLLWLDVAIVIAILVTGGTELAVADRAISVRTIVNPLIVFWALLALWICTRWRVHFSLGATSGGSAQSSLRLIAIASTTFLCVASRVLWNAMEVWQRGDYVTQTYVWRNAPGGVDLATLLIGNPMHPLWGGLLRRVYEWGAIDRVESACALGVGPLLLLARSKRLFRTPDVRHWAVVGLAFLLWALGPFLIVLGVNSWMVLPQAIVRFVPILNNARIPGRAIVMVYLALAVICACALADLARRGRGARWLWLFPCLVALEYSAGWVPLYPVDRPAIYRTLREAPGIEPAGVLELPLGLRDGFGELGVLDHRALLYQTLHGRPIGGGFVARLSPALRDRYLQAPTLRLLVQLSGNAAHAPGPPIDSDRKQARDLRRHGFGYLVLDDRTAPPPLRAYVHAALPLKLLAADGTRRLFEIEPDTAR